MINVVHKLWTWRFYVNSDDLLLLIAHDHVSHKNCALYSSRACSTAERHLPSCTISSTIHVRCRTIFKCFYCHIELRAIFSEHEIMDKLPESIRTLTKVWIEVELFTSIEQSSMKPNIPPSDWLIAAIQLMMIFITFRRFEFITKKSHGFCTHSRP